MIIRFFFPSDFSSQLSVPGRLKNGVRSVKHCALLWTRCSLVEKTVTDRLRLWRAAASGLQPWRGSASTLLTCGFLDAHDGSGLQGRALAKPPAPHYCFT